MGTTEEQPSLSRSEWKVMKIVWPMQKAMAREVYTVAGDQEGWSPNTVKTLLKRLVDKGYLATTKVGNGFVYRPTQNAIVSLRSAADTLLGNAIEGTTGPLLQHMIQSSRLDQSDLDELQQILDEKKRSLAKKASRASQPRRKR